MTAPPTAADSPLHDLAQLASTLCGAPMAMITLVDGARHRCGVCVGRGADVRFYAGVPLRTREGHVVGTLCVLDRQPRALDEAQCTALRTIARQVVAQLELDAIAHELRTPLTAIHGSLGLLAAGVLGELPAEAREMVRVAERNSTRMVAALRGLA